MVSRLGVGLVWRRIAMVALIIVMAACTWNSAKQKESGDDPATVALKYLTAASSYTVGGRATQSGVPYSFALDVQGVDLHGTVEVGGLPVEVTKMDRRYFIRSAQYMRTVASNADIIGNDWILWGANDLTRLLDKLTDESAVAASIKHSSSGLRSGRDSLDGVLATKLSNQEIVIWTTLDQPVRPLRIETRLDHPLSNALTDVRLNYSKFNEPVSMVPVSEWVDPNNWNTLRPAFRRASPGDFEDCGPAGCSYSVDVKNWGGSRGESTYIITFTRSSGASLGTCSGSIPTTTHLQTTRLSCRTTTQAWTNFWYSPNDDSWTALTDIHNPNPGP